MSSNDGHRLRPILCCFGSLGRSTNDFDPKLLRPESLVELEPVLSKSTFANPSPEGLNLARGPPEIWKESSPCAAGTHIELIQPVDRSQMMSAVRAARSFVSPDSPRVELNVLSETTLFINSMLSDMETRARVITSLDTMASFEQALWSTQAIQAALMVDNESLSEHESRTGTVAASPTKLTDDAGALSLSKEPKWMPEVAHRKVPLDSDNPPPVRCTTSSDANDAVKLEGLSALTPETDPETGLTFEHQAPAACAAPDPALCAGTAAAACFGQQEVARGAEDADWPSPSRLPSPVSPPVAPGLQTASWQPAPAQQLLLREERGGWRGGGPKGAADAAAAAGSHGGGADGHASNAADGGDGSRSGVCSSSAEDRCGGAVCTSGSSGHSGCADTAVGRSRLTSGSGARAGPMAAGDEADNKRSQRPSAPSPASETDAAQSRAGDDAAVADDEVLCGLDGAPVPACDLDGGQRYGCLVLPSLLALLSDLVEAVGVEALPMTPGTRWSCCGVVMRGTWRGQTVAIKLTTTASMDEARPFLTATSRMHRLRHTHLLAVHQVRAARVDAQSLALLDPSPMLRSDWAVGQQRPQGRLHRFLAVHSLLPVQQGVALRAESLTIYPGDVVVQRPVTTPLQRLAASLRPQLGGVVIATIMEFSEMGNLETLACSTDSPFRLSRVWAPRASQRALLRTAREIAAGLRVLHAAGLTHGALQPSNVLLFPSSADRRGFVARITDVASPSLSQAASNPLCSGPCMFMLAPEALTDGLALRSLAADVYSYGMLLYLMAAGEMPFEGRHLVPVLMAVSAEGLRPDWPEGSHNHLEHLYRRCVAQRPEDRPSMKEVLAEICALEKRIKSPA